MLLRIVWLICCFYIISCDNNSDNPAPDSDNDSSEIPESIYERIYGATTEITFDNDWVYISVIVCLTMGAPTMKGRSGKKTCMFLMMDLILSCQILC